MKIKFLNRHHSNTRLILIFAGWSTTPEFYESVKMESWDVAVVYDYADLSFDSAFLNEYYTVYLFSWSLGVFISDIIIPADRITAAFALNGTLSPVDDGCGIPDAVFTGTADGLSPSTLLKFRKRMMPDIASFKAKFSTQDVDNIEELRESLYVIKKRSLEPQNTHLPWTRAYISSDDRIFPASNQRRAWEQQKDTEIVYLEGAHYVPLEEVVKSVIADTFTVSQKFSKASSSYNTNAIAQLSAAVHLAGMLRNFSPEQKGNILEIGCGTGLFTREYASILKPLNATFVDISSCGPFEIAPEETYVQADAELWIQNDTNLYDAILSTSAIQWFANIPRFILECSSRLKENGILAISTFLPGNMRELDELRPSPIIYPTLSLLENSIMKCFREFTIEHEEICVEFKSVREMLLHLKHTGVAGSSPSAKNRLSDFAGVNKLTYTPVYIVARK